MRFEKAIPYDILIRGTPNQGFIVEVGCVKVAYAQAETLLNDLTEYLKYPKEVEKQYNHDISSLARVHIGNAPDITVTPYGAGNTASGISMLARERLEK